MQTAEKLELLKNYKPDELEIENHGRQPEDFDIDEFLFSGLYDEDFIIRVKQKPIYRPFETIEEIIPYLGKKMFNNGKTDARLLNLIWEGMELLINGHTTQWIFENYCFEGFNSGIPCGTLK